MSTTLGSYADLAVYLTNELSSLSSGPALLAVRAAAIQFCVDTGIWEQDLAPMQRVAWQQDYTLTTTQDALISAIMKLSVDGSRDWSAGTYELTGGNTLQFAPYCAPQDSDSIAAYNASAIYNAGDNVYYGTGDAYQIYAAITAIATPEAWTASHWRIDYSVGIRVRAQLIPNDSSTGVPTWVLNQYRNGLLAGARLVLYKQPNKPWTPLPPRYSRRMMVPPAIMEAQQDYQRAVHDAKTSKLMRGTAGPLVGRIASY